MRELHDIITKYAEDQLSEAELAELRRTTDDCSDEELGQAIEQIWTSKRIAPQNPPKPLWLEIKQRINPERKRSPVPWWVWAWQGVAAVLVAVGLVWVYQSRMPLQADSPIVVATESGQRVTITLPDGTTVRLNPESSLSYAPSQFGREERWVEYSGDAFFDVAADTEKPFVIRTQGTWVRVLGTRFSVTSRSVDSLVSVALERGKVWFGAANGMASGILTEGQEGVWNKKTNRLIIRQLKGSAQAGYGTLVFRRATLDQVAAAMGKHYGVRVSVSEDIPTRKDCFSGTLPSDDVFDALRVLERTYDIPSNRVDVDIRLQANQ